MVEDDPWIYYVNHWDVQTGIYKELPAGSNPELVVGLTVDDDHRIALLGVQNETLYYSYIKDLAQEQSIYRVDPSGSTVLLQTIDYSGFDLTLDGDWIYYLVNSESARYSDRGFCFNTLKRASVDGSQLEELIDCVNSSKFEIAEGYIYYNDVMSGFNRLRLDGSQQHVLSAIQIDAVHFEVDGDWIYFREETSPNNVIRAHMKTGEQQSVTNHTAQVRYAAYKLKSSNGYLYYELWNNDQHADLYQIKLDGTEGKKIAPMLDSYYITSDSIYTFSRLNEPRRIHTLDGIEVESDQAEEQQATEDIEKIEVKASYGNILEPGFGQGINFLANFVLGKDKRIYMLEDGTLRQVDDRLVNVHQFAITMGNVLIVLKEDGTVWQWDGDAYYEEDKFLPAKGIKQKVIQISGSYSNAIALQEDGTVIDYLPFHRNFQVDEAVLVPNLTEIVQVSAGEDYSLALGRDGTVWAWGYNEHGQLGNGQKDYNFHDPAKIEGLEDIVQISTDRTYALALKKDGTVWAWGENELGQLGKIGSTKPMILNGLSKIVKLSPGMTNFAIDMSDEVWAWGANHYGQLANGKTNYVWRSDNDPVTHSISTYYEPLPNPNPVKVEGINNVIAIAKNYPHTVIALTEDGEMWHWGNMNDTYLAYRGLENESANEEILSERNIQMSPTFVTSMENWPIFSDVSLTHWGYDSIKWAAENSIVEGVGDGRFNPDDLLTRAEATAFMKNLVDQGITTIVQ